MQDYADLNLKIAKLERLCELQQQILEKLGAAVQGHQRSIESLAEATGLVRRSTQN
jgi:hypothetical protein